MPVASKPFLISSAKTFPGGLNGNTGWVEEVLVPQPYISPSCNGRSPDLLHRI